MNKSIILTLLLIASLTTLAQDRHFAWSYNTPTLPAGNVDVEAWNTFCTGREEYFFQQLTQRIEFEFGVTDMIQTSLYLNAKHKAIGPMASDASLSMQRSSEFSFSNAWKFFLISPHQQPIGVSAYLEYYLAPGEIELEGKMMVDKLTEKHWFVFNSTVEAEFENEFEKGESKILRETDTEWKLEQTLGYMYNFSSRLGLGLEVRNVSKLAEGQVDYSALFVGPTLFIGSEKYFLIFNILPQIANLARKATSLELSDQERYTFRVLLGVSL